MFGTINIGGRNYPEVEPDIIQVGWYVAMAGADGTLELLTAILDKTLISLHNSRLHIPIPEARESQNRFYKVDQDVWDRYTEE